MILQKIGKICKKYTQKWPIFIAITLSFDLLMKIIYSFDIINCMTKGIIKYVWLTNLINCSNKFVPVVVSFFREDLVLN